jgi:MFS family permease
MRSLLRYPNFRLWLVITIITGAGNWMQLVTQDWLVLEVTDSVFMLGVVAALQTAPFLILGPIGGALADRFTRWWILLLTQLGTCLCGVASALLALTGQANIWNVGAIAFLAGAVNALFQPSAQSFVPELVPPIYIGGAISVATGAVHASRLLGAGVSGLLIEAASSGMVLLLSAFLVAVACILMFSIQRRTLVHTPTPPGRALVLDGVRYVVGKRSMLLIFGVLFLVSAFALNSQMVTFLMVQVFDKGATELGVMGSSVAIGSIVGGLALARLGRVDHRFVVASALVFCALQAVFAMVPNYTTFIILLVPLGLVQIGFIAAATTTLQMTAAPAMRGRIMALYLVILMGSRPLGSVVLGWTADLLGPRGAVIGTASLLPLVGTLGLAMVLRPGLDAHRARHAWQGGRHVWTGDMAVSPSTTGLWRPASAGPGLTNDGFTGQGFTRAGYVVRHAGGRRSVMSPEDSGQLGSGRSAPVPV